MFLLVWVEREAVGVHSSAMGVLSRSSAPQLGSPSPLASGVQLVFHMKCDLLRTLKALTSLTSQPPHPWKSRNSQFIW